MTIAAKIPSNIVDQMNALPEVDWDKVITSAVQGKLDELELAERIATKSKLTNKDVRIFSDKITRIASQKFLK